MIWWVQEYPPFYFRGKEYAMQRLTEIIQCHMKPVSQENLIKSMQAYSFQEILQYVKEVPAEEILFVRDAFMMNMEVLEEGLQSILTFHGSRLKRENGGRMISSNVRKTAQLFCGGTLEAWDCKIVKSIMGLGGSGVCGIIATMPLLAYQQVYRDLISVDRILYATAISYLVTMNQMSDGIEYIKSAGVGMACGLCYLQGGDDRQIEAARDLMLQYTFFKESEKVVDWGMSMVDTAFFVVAQAMEVTIGEI